MVNSDGPDRLLGTIQTIAGQVQEYLAEAAAIRTVYERFPSEFQYDCYVEAVSKASICAERMTEKLRRLTFDSISGMTEKREYQKRLVEVHKIRIGLEDGILQAELPMLLPHRKHKYSDYLYYPVFQAFQEWCRVQEEQRNQIPAYEQAVVCFCHIYQAGTKMGRIRDHDNVEEKQIVDVLGTFFLLSDGGMYLDTYHTSMFGKQDKTVLYLMEKERFAAWIEREMGIEKIEKNCG